MHRVENRDLQTQAAFDQGGADITCAADDKNLVLVGLLMLPAARLREWQQHGQNAQQFGNHQFVVTYSLSSPAAAGEESRRTATAGYLPSRVMP